MKGLSNYFMKEAYLEDLLTQIIVEQADSFTVSQLEMLMWSLSKRINNKCHYPEKMDKAANAIMQRVLVKSASMKPRGVAFAAEAICQLPQVNDEAYIRLERVILSKIRDFIPHYYVKIIAAFNKVGQGSGELYS